MPRYLQKRVMVGRHMGQKYKDVLDSVRHDTIGLCHDYYMMYTASGKTVNP